MDTLISILIKLTTGEVGMLATAETASFDDIRQDVSAVLSASASLSFEQMWSVTSHSFWSDEPTASYNNYRAVALDQSQTALEAAFVVSQSFA